jgi:hypothetical protein
MDTIPIRPRTIAMRANVCSCDLVAVHQAQPVPELTKRVHWSSSAAQSSQRWAHAGVASRSASCRR